jgi:hypothetical protein
MIVHKMLSDRHATATPFASLQNDSCGRPLYQVDAGSEVSKTELLPGNPTPEANPSDKPGTPSPSTLPSFLPLAPKSTTIESSVGLCCSKTRNGEEEAASHGKSQIPSGPNSIHLVEPLTVPLLTSRPEEIQLYTTLKALDVFILAEASPWVLLPSPSNTRGKTGATTYPATNLPRLTPPLLPFTFAMASKEVTISATDYDASIPYWRVLPCFDPHFTEGLKDLTTWKQLKLKDEHIATSNTFIQAFQQEIQFRNQSLRYKKDYIHLEGHFAFIVEEVKRACPASAIIPDKEGRMFTFAPTIFHVPAGTHPLAPKKRTVLFTFGDLAFAQRNVKVWSKVDVATV